MSDVRMSVNRFVAKHPQYADFTLRELVQYFKQNMNSFHNSTPFDAFRDFNKTFGRLDDEEIEELELKELP